MNAIRFLTNACYGILALVFLAAGTSVLLIDTGLLPGLRQGILEESGGDLNALHLAQELGCCLVFMGLISLWFVWNYERSHALHWSLTVFWGLLALVHWFDVRGTAPSLEGGLVIGAPLLLFLAIGLVRLAAEGSPCRLERPSAADPSAEASCPSPGRG